LLLQTLVLDQLELTHHYICV
jgi:serine/threonine protein kinase